MLSGPLGSASHSHCGGRRFESDQVHHWTQIRTGSLFWGRFSFKPKGTPYHDGRECLSLRFAREAVSLSALQSSQDDLIFPQFFLIHMTRNTGRTDGGFKYPLSISGYLSDVLRDYIINREFFHGLPQHTKAIQRGHHPAVNLIHTDDVIIQSGRIRVKIPTQSLFFHELLNGGTVTAGHIGKSPIKTFLPSRSYS